MNERFILPSRSSAEILRTQSKLLSPSCDPAGTNRSPEWKLRIKVTQEAPWKKWSQLPVRRTLLKKLSVQQPQRATSP